MAQSPEQFWCTVRVESERRSDAEFRRGEHGVLIRPEIDKLPRLEVDQILDVS